ncbi:MAG TPA: DUF433 domain-containing protein [Pyrinomonadaceae bacterium]
MKIFFGGNRNKVREILKKDRKILKTLMLGLIYPAVLGNIIYLSIDQIVRQVKLFFTVTHIEPNPVLRLKFAFLLVTLAFYFSDYLYIYFTKKFRLSFFIYDILFVIALLTTAIAINMENPSELPDIRIITGCYFFFMLLYLVWDVTELRDCQKLKCSNHEIRFYWKIIAWEIFSIVLLIWQGVNIYSSGIELVPRNTLFWILLFITVCFWIVTIYKGKFHNSEEFKMNENLIEVDAEKLGGTPVFYGTRVPIQILFDCLETGETLDRFLEQFPTVTREQAVGVLKESKEKLLVVYESAA